MAFPLYLRFLEMQARWVFDHYEDNRQIVSVTIRRNAMHEEMISVHLKDGRRDHWIYRDRCWNLTLTENARHPKVQAAEVQGEGNAPQALPRAGVPRS